MHGIPDFYLEENDLESIDDVSAIWQDEDVVNARDTIYNLCTRELKGMAFCMQEMAHRTDQGSRILEAGMGTGHFTHWLAEVAVPGTEIVAFDCSWPILRSAQQKLHGVPNVSLFRANSRSRLPFPDHHFDLLLVRLAPLGPHGVANIEVGARLLKPGGWYFEAGWDRPQYANTWTDWAIQHGFEHAEQHTWQYPRQVTDEEAYAWEIEQAAWPADHKKMPFKAVGNVRMTIENIYIAQKP